jgi:hypothetical protein
MITNQDSPYKDLYDPNRLKPVAGFSNFVNHNVDVVKQFASKWFSHEELHELAELATEEGKIVNFKDEKVASIKIRRGHTCFESNLYTCRLRSKMEQCRTNMGLSMSWCPLFL